MIIGKTVKALYKKMQKNYLSFRLLVWLKEKGVTRYVNHIISSRNHKVNAMSKMQEAREFFLDSEVQKRIQVIMSELEDDYSRDILNRVIMYRMYGKAIPKDYFSENDQYFPNGIISLNEEVFVDCGAYTGDTVQQLLDVAKKSKAVIHKIIAFEPDVSNYEIIHKYYGKNPNIYIYNLGVSDKNNVLYFKSSGATARIVNDKKNADFQIRVTNLDSVPECRDATYIKMDIEGAEYNALLGASGIIKANRPKLAICIYHTNEDIVRLIELVKEMVPEYRLYIRHHSRSEVETVLYAII